MQIHPDTLRTLEATTPPTEAVQDRVREYMALTGLPLKSIAQHVNYGVTTLSHFMCGRYTSQVSKTDVSLRRSLVDWMDSHPVTISTQTTGTLYETANVRTMRTWFERCLSRREMAFVYGPPGAQKTFVLEHLVAAHNRREIPLNGHGTRAFSVYCTEAIRPRDLLRKMARAAAVPSTGTVLGTLTSLRYSLAGRKTLFVLDEAQHLSISCLEVVRELNDQSPHAGILLAGSHRLLQLFKERAAELEQWNSRLSGGVALPGIDPAEAADIITAELGQQDTKKVKKLVDLSRVHDRYAKHQYISARRLFHQIADIKVDPRFTTQGGQL